MARSRMTKGHRRLFRDLLKNKYNMLNETPSYRDLLPPELNVADPSDKSAIYLTFVEECGGASEDTKRKLRRRLGLS